MGKSDITIREDEMWCPECGAPIKQGFYACSNCKLKVRMTQDINREQDKKSRKKPKKKSKKQVKKEEAPVKEEIKEDIPADNKEDFPVKDDDPPVSGPKEINLTNPVNKEGHPRYWNF